MDVVGIAQFFRWSNPRRNGLVTSSAETGRGGFGGFTSLGKSGLKLWLLERLPQFQEHRQGKKHLRVCSEGSLYQPRRGASPKHARDQRVGVKDQLHVPAVLSERPSLQPRCPLPTLDHLGEHECHPGPA